MDPIRLPQPRAKLPGRGRPALNDVARLASRRGPVPPPSPISVKPTGGGGGSRTPARCPKPALTRSLSTSHNVQLWGFAALRNPHTCSNLRNRPFRPSAKVPMLAGFVSRFRPFFGLLFISHHLPALATFPAFRTALRRIWHGLPASLLPARPERAADGLNLF